MQFHFFSVAQYLQIGLCNQRQLVQYTLGSNLLKDTDDQVGNYNPQKKQIFKGADKNNQSCQNSIDQIKQG